jgi:hypothetical protein
MVGYTGLYFYHTIANLGQCLLIRRVELKACTTTGLNGLSLPQKITTPLTLDFSFILLDEISNRFLYSAMKAVRG